MKMPLVTVIIPNYNHAKYLKQRIDSVLNQTYTSFEVIILDDCSTDNSKDIILSYKDNPHISNIVLNSENSGSTFKQWNKGFELAKGDYIWIAESDDYCDLNLLELLLTQIRKHSLTSIVYTSSHLVDEKGHYIKKIRKKGVQILGGEAFIMKHMMMGNAILNASSAIFSKEALGKCKLDYTTFKAGGDRLFWIYLAEHGRVIHLREAHNYFRQHNKKVTSNAAKSGLGFIESLKIYDYLKSHGYLYGFREHLTHGYYMWLIGHVKGYENSQVKGHIYDLWKPKCSHPILNEYLFILYRIYTKLISLF
ncbi:glycosyltransferase family 2 protein [Parabacteroides sp. APC149_11_2_Y6]